MNSLAASLPGKAALAAALALCALPAASAEFRGEPAERLAAYEAAISSADPSAAAALLRDGEARELLDARQDAPAVLGRAEALKDLKDLLALRWDAASANRLSQSLALRIDEGTPLTALGVGPEPEKVLAWLGRWSPRYPAEKKEVVRKAVREWAVVFGTATDTTQLNWGQARLGSGRGVSVTRAGWERMTLRERNAVLERLTDTYPGFLIYNDERLASMKKTVALDVDVRALIATLPPEQQSRLTGLRFEDQLYVLGNMFDNSTVTASPELRARIDAARSSLPREVLQSQHRQVLGTMLNTAVAAELRGTRAGDRALAAFPGGLRITVAPVEGGYSRYDAATGSVVLDSETVQQYMRARGYTSETVLRDPAQLRELAKYMAPAVVYEAGHKSQADWARAGGLYLPRTQENEIEAMSLEALFTTEKLASDPEFSRILGDSRAFSSYASKRLDVATEFRSGRTRGFSDAVRQRYFPALPSLDAAASRVLLSVSGELERRAALPAAEQALLRTNGLTLQEAMEMSPEELAGSVGEIQTTALADIQGDLSRLGTYRSRYSSANMQNAAALRAITAARP